MVWVCKKCNLTWYYPVDTCIYCKSKIEIMNPTTYTIRGITKVFTPSPEHSTVPYYDLLLEDEQGNFYIRKAFQSYELGDEISDRKKEVKVKKVGIVGTGVTGCGIVQISLQAGCETVLKSRSKEAIEKALEKIEMNLLKVMKVEAKDKVLCNLKPTEKLEDLSDVDIIIESVIEDIDIKKELFKELDKICSRKTILATNTSSLSINEIASVTSNPNRVIGIHFFNPIPKMQLVEIVAGEKTSQETIEFAKDFAKQLSKVPVITTDTPGFIVNRILMPYLNEAVYALYEGVASPSDIDTAAKLGLNHPIGPLALLDLIGLDIFLAIMNSLYQRTANPKYLPCLLVEKMVREGKLGRKTKEGFYKY
ncbi:MAG: 3-hydroxyacyl-CoA dehydrogenase family protein [bacterium]|nr:3-hydroxyacyl-CoA dehydrogenase family protein [bacterium]